jgi:hypothetical protein
MRKSFKILFSLIAFLLFAGIASAQMGGGISYPNFLKPCGGGVCPISTMYDEIGQVGTPWAKGYFTDLNVAGLFTVGGTVVGNIDYNNYLALNIGNAGTDFTAGGGLNIAGNLAVVQGTTAPGTVSVSGTAVTGVGTTFTSTFLPGDTITVTTTSGSETKAITTITSDTVLVTAAFAGTASAGTAYTLVGGTRLQVLGNGVTVSSKFWTDLDPLDHIGNALFGRNAGRYIAFDPNDGLQFHAGSGNTLIGVGSGRSNTTGKLNTFLGLDSGRDNISGSYNTFLGIDAGQSNLSGQLNTAIGHRAAGTNLSSEITAVGVYANENGSTGTKNTFIGSYSGRNLTTAKQVTAIGYSALGLGVLVDTTGDDNTAMGYSAGQNTTGLRNTYMGSSAGFNVLGGSRNTGVGASSLFSLTTGISNTGIGDNAGYLNSTGHYNTNIGSQSTASANNFSSSTAIGAYSTITASNQLVIGSVTASLTDAYFGQGVTSASPAGIAINASGGSGTDNAGAPLTIAGGKSTGSALGGSIFFKTSNVAATGTALNTLADRMTISPAGLVGIGVAPTALLSLKEGTTVADGIAFGSDVNLYRTAANSLRTDDTFNVGGGASVAGTFQLLIGSGHGEKVITDDGLHIGVPYVDNVGNRVFSFVDGAYIDKDFDHDTLQTNPTVFFHSAVDPDSDNTQWGSLSHDQSDFVVNAGKGGFKVNTRLRTPQGADVASATNLVLGADGNSFEITGTTKIDLISNLGWGNGDQIKLVCNENVTFDDGTATSGTNITIALAGGGDFSCTAQDILVLELKETTASGQFWGEVSRSAN